MPATSPFDARRRADRLRWQAQVRARPMPAKFRGKSILVRLLSEPAKLLTARAGGFTPNYAAEIILVLPDGDSSAVKSTETIDLRDLSGATQTYNLTTVTALEGYGCYRLGLSVRMAKPTALAARP